jgi:hypothetical protein
MQLHCGLKSVFTFPKHARHAVSRSIEAPNKEMTKKPVHSKQ